MIQLPHHRWQPNSLRELIWVVGIAVALVFVFIVFCGYLFELKWTGLVKNVNFHKRTLWDWLDLLIIPAVLAAGGLWFNQRQQARAEMSETQRAQDEALQAYLDKMSDLLIDKGLHKKKGDYDETRVTAHPNAGCTGAVGCKAQENSSVVLARSTPNQSIQILPSWSRAGGDILPSLRRAWGC